MAQADIIQVFDRSRQRLAFLQNAFDIGYKKTLNSLWYADFSLPADDPKNQYCKPFNYVELFDGKERVELFRIVGEDLTRSTQAVTVYNCEHVLATLIDDCLFQYHQIGNIGVYTSTVIRYVLDRQTEKNWRLGQCDFERQYEYKWENENLLAALFSIANPLVEPYIWEWDTTGYPWILKLKTLSDDIKSEIRYGKNMTQITKTTDAANVITRLYCLGYGEGDNQLDIRAVNGGLPFLDAPTMATWGMKASILVDRRFEEPQSLKAYGQQILNGAQNPYISYSAEAVDLYKLTGQRYDKFNVGDMVKVIDKADGINEAFPIMEISKSDLTGNPGGISVTIANKSKDLSGSISELQNRANINDLYAQGATNQVMVSFADNADTGNPALMKLYIPESMVRVNSCVLNFEFESFRAYEKGVASAQQNVQSTSSTNTNSSTSSMEQTQTRSTSTSAPPSASTNDGGGSYPTTSQDNTTNLWKLSGSYSPIDVMSSAGDPSHAHGLVPHDHAHNHSISIPTHRHTVSFPSHDHTVTIPSHSHTVDIPGHNHSLTIPSHSHDVQYGIFKGSSVNAGRLHVNGKYKQDVSPNTNINLADMLANPKTKRINRNTFHRIEIYPVATSNNSQGLTRIVANIFLQIFTNSRGSGDF